MKKVSVVILNYKVKEETLRCILSLKKSDYQNIELITVDNNSGDGIEEEVKKMEGVTFIQTHSNLGYTGGNNIGIKKALEGKADFVFILNPDTEVEKDVISSLVNVAEATQAGIIGPKILFSNKKTIWYAGGIMDLANVLGKHRGVDLKDEGQYNNIEETEFVTGGAMFVRRDVFEKVGLFDEKYFMYLEDSDLCFRAKKMGFKILYNPKAVIYHENAKSAGLGSSLQDYFITRNRMLFAAKFLSFRTKFALFREALRHITNPVRRLAFYDFLTGNFGKGSFLK
ncbi:MAG: glycosyltransferase family 2 protein [Candidatus Daviesbacteria bacterium]|nr:glycosyltransferase family 2 protein [Candidatus Daviesbacteria bacterium]